MVDIVDAVDGRELLSQAEYARRKKVTRQRINKLVKDGVLPLHGGRIDAAEADRIIQEMAHGSFEHNRKMLPLHVAASPDPASLPPPATTDDVPDVPTVAPHATDEAVVDDIFEHLKKLIFNGRDMKDVPHVEIKKLNDFIGAVQRKLEIQTQARTLIPIEEAQTTFVEVAGRVREGLLNVADQIAGATSAKALELLRGHLPPDSQPVLDQLLQGKQWEDLFHRTINQEMAEVLRALSDTPRLVRQP